MSWDIFVQDLPSGINRAADIPSTFAPGVICTRSEVLEVVRELAPSANLSDRSWVVVQVEGVYHIEMNLGDSEQLESFAIHAAGGREAHAFVSQVLGRLGLRALDSQSETGLFESEAG